MKERELTIKIPDRIWKQLEYMHEIWGYDPPLTVQLVLDKYLFNLKT